MESLAPEVAPFGIRTMVVEPGFFRTDLLTPESTSYAESSIDDYAERTEQTVAAWNGMNGQQGGDPAKLATRPGRARRPPTSRRCAGSPAPTPSPVWSRRRLICSPRSTPTATCRSRCRTTPPDR